MVSLLCLNKKKNEAGFCFKMKTLKLIS